MSSREVDPIARADVHAHLTNATAQSSGVAEVAQAGGFQSHEDSRFGLGIAEPAQSLGKGVGLPQAEHGRIVSPRIQLETSNYRISEEVEVGQARKDMKEIVGWRRSR
jgi:hypothetical protein